MRTRKLLGIAAVVLTSACGLDAAGDLPVDAGVAPTEAALGDVRGVDARHDALRPDDATVGDAAKEGGQLSNDSATDVATDSAQADGTSGDDGGVHDAAHADAGVPHDGAPADGSTHDASSGDTGQHDSGEHDSGGHDAGPHEAGLHDGASSEGGEHDASGHDAGTVTQPPNICIIDYSCGSATCNCNETCATDECAGCVDHYSTCNNILGTCGTDLSGILNCGSCGNACPGCSFGSYATCNASGSTYACGCASL